MGRQSAAAHPVVPVIKRSRSLTGHFENGSDSLPLAGNALQGSATALLCHLCNVNKLTARQPANPVNDWNVVCNEN
jgi:hypothetical protein